MSKGMIEELSGEMKEDLLRAIPANRFGEVEQLGTLIEYLMGPDADYMTGQILNLNGGLYGG
jgi:3-oxoacyl-[acyl-carrier protein] reductase